MDEISKALTSPAWWVLSGFFAVAVNILSAYCKGPIDRLLGRISSSRRAKAAKAAELFQKKALILSRTVEGRAVVFQMEVRMRLMQLTAMVFAAILFGGAAFVLYLEQGGSHWFSMFLAVLAFIVLLAAMTTSTIVAEMGEVLMEAVKLGADEDTRTSADAVKKQEQRS